MHHAYSTSTDVGMLSVMHYIAVKKAVYGLLCESFVADCQTSVSTYHFINLNPVIFSKGVTIVLRSKTL
jgi:hypothetical protein